MAVSMRSAAMLPRNLQVAQAAVATHGASAPARNAVNLAALKMRIRATKNVAKITNVMKLVSSSKLRGVEQLLERGKAFGESILNAVAIPQPVRKVEKGKEDEAIGIFQGSEGNTVKHLAVVITTDKGLCGAVNSSLSRMVRRELNVAVKSNAANVRVITLGDKGRAQIARDYIPVMSRAIDQAFDKDPIFPLAAALATKIVREPYDLLTLFYNHYENQAKFTNTYKQIPQLAKAKPGSMPATLTGYDVEPKDNSETLINLQEYAVASALFYAMLETVACETSQRVIAMDNATTNAKDMVHRLSLVYNRGRQAKITTELTEIISGAETLVVEGGKD